MRVVGGKKKGKKLILPLDKNTRPLKDMLKESLFNILKHSNVLNFKIENKNILDLFSGVGSFGIECLSRGAKKVVFFENLKKTSEILRKNIINFNYEEKSKIIEVDIYKKNSFSIFKEKFGLVFLDLPFKENRVSELIDQIKNYKILEKNGLKILHRHVNANDILPSYLNILLKKKYGKSKVIFAKI